MPYTLSPNMNLILPTVGQEPGPTWASDLNTSLSILDTHDHSSGNGLTITPAGITISSDLSFIANNATNLRSSRYSSQVSALALPTDLNAFYVLNGDAYFVDGLGNNIRFTQGGSIAGATGSITGLMSPASVTYVSGTPAFVFQSDASTSANLDGGSLTIRENVASANGITINSPTSLAANYSLTLPLAPPGSTSLVQMSSSGVISASNTVSNTLVLNGLISATSTTNIFSGNIQLNGTFLSLSGGVTSITDLGGVLSMPPMQIGGSLGSQAQIQAGVAGGPGSIGIVNVDTGTNFPIVVSAGPSTYSLKIVRGIVNSSGSSTGGEGFAPSRVTTGTYNVSFSNAFFDIPAITFCSEGNAPALRSLSFGMTSQSAANFTVEVRNPSLQLTDVNWNFIAIGQRL